MSLTSHASHSQGNTVGAQYIIAVRINGGLCHKHLLLMRPISSVKD